MKIARYLCPHCGNMRVKSVLDSVVILPDVNCTNCIVGMCILVDSMDYYDYVSNDKLVEADGLALKRPIRPEAVSMSMMGMTIPIEESSTNKIQRLEEEKENLISGVRELQEWAEEQAGLITKQKKAGYRTVRHQVEDEGKKAVLLDMVEHCKATLE